MRICVCTTVDCDDADVVAVALQDSKPSVAALRNDPERAVYGRALAAKLEGHSEVGYRRNGALRLFIYARTQVSIQASAECNGALVTVCKLANTTVAFVCLRLSEPAYLSDCLRQLGASLALTNGIILDEAFFASRTTHNHACQHIVLMSDFGRPIDVLPPWTGVDEDVLAQDRIFWRSLTLPLRRQGPCARTKVVLELSSAESPPLNLKEHHRLVLAKLAACFSSDDKPATARVSLDVVAPSGETRSPSRGDQASSGGSRRDIKSESAALRFQREVEYADSTAKRVSQPAECRWDDDAFVVDDVALPGTTIVLSVARAVDDKQVNPLASSRSCEALLGGATVSAEALAANGRNGWVAFEAPLVRYGKVLGTLSGVARSVVGHITYEACASLFAAALDEDEGYDSVTAPPSSNASVDEGATVDALHNQLRAAQVQLKLTETKLTSERSARCRAERRAATAVEAMRSRSASMSSEDSCRTAWSKNAFGDAGTSTSFLRSIPFFKCFNEAQLAQLHEAFVLRDYDDGEHIIDQGDAASDEFYVVVRGRVRVSVRSHDKSAQVAVLSAGDYFGERALVLNEPRASTCVADGSVSCWVLERDAFEAATHGMLARAELRAAFSGYEHNAREASTSRLEEYIMAYADAVAPSSPSLQVVRDRLARGECEAPAIAVLLLEARTPELSLNEALERVLAVASELFSRAPRLYFPVDVQSRAACPWRCDKPELMPWQGVIAAAATSGTTACDKTDVAAAVRGSAGTVVGAVAVSVDAGPCQGHIRALELVAAALGAVLREKHAAVEFLTGANLSYLCSVDVAQTPNVVVQTLHVTGDRFVREESLYLRALVLHGTTPLTEPWESKLAQLRRQDGAYVADFRDARVEFVASAPRRDIGFRDLPLAATLQISMYAAGGHRELASCAMPLWDEEHACKAGVRSLRLCVPARGDVEITLDVDFHRIDGCEVLYDDGASMTVATRRAFARRRATLHVNATKSKAPPEPSTAFQHRSTRLSMTEQRDTIGRLMREQALSEVTETEALWRARRSLTSVPTALPKLLRAVDWSTSACWRDAHRLLHAWALMRPLAALELLSSQYPDPATRAYAVACLEALGDAEVAALMLQLVQVVKFERSHDTALNRFLLRRALRNPSVCGHALYWSLATEKDVGDEQQRCRVLFDLYSRSCGPYRARLGHQVVLVSKLAEIAAKVVHATHTEDRDALLRRELENIVLPRSFQLPLSPFMVCRGVDVAKCRVLTSARKPLYLTFRNAVSDGPAHVVIFKTGDDLRQDQLTLQIIRCMDAVWQDAGLDLRMSPYGCVATAKDQGFVEVVPHAATLAAITRHERFQRARPALRVSRKVRAAREAYYGKRSLRTWIEREARAFATEMPSDDREARRQATSEARRASAAALDDDDDDDNHIHKEHDDGTSGAFAFRQAGLCPPDDDSDAFRDMPRPWDAKAADFENPLRLGLAVEAALENFTRSLAGYCVATYVLGIGDRHNDNIMCTRDGKIFHIDFGHFMGNFKTRFKFRRETAPFVLTPHCEAALGGAESGARFRHFEELATKAYVVLRRHKDLIVTLLELMVGAGIPELRNTDDVNWVHRALMVEDFSALIEDSRLCKRTRTNHAVHSFVHTT